MKLCGVEVGLKQPFFLIAGPCAIESEELALSTAQTLKEITGRLGIHFIYKSSFDKANRSSIHSFRGPGIDEGLKILQEIKEQFNCWKNNLLMLRYDNEILVDEFKY